MKWMSPSRCVLLVSVLVASACAPASPSRPGPRVATPPLPIPPDLREEVQFAEEIGHELYLLDKAAAIATDVLAAEHKGFGELGGYLPFQAGDESGRPQAAFYVLFHTREATPRIAYRVRVAPEGNQLEAMVPPRAATSAELTFIRARQTAIAALPEVSQPINPVLLPGEARGEHGILVYLLAGTKTPNVAVFGRHFRALVPIGGEHVTYMMPLSNTALELRTRAEDGAAVRALAVTHVVTDAPLETHVFTSWLVGKPVFVQTRRGLWRVANGRVSFLEAALAERTAPTRL